MQITIYPPVNDPPIIAEIKDTCILAGSTLAFTVNVTEPNGELVTLTASGGPFQTAISPATFTSTPANGSTTGDFNWVTDCSHVRKNPFTVVFKAVDNNTQVQLVDLEQLFITVVAPAPQNPFTTAQGNSLVLNWDSSLCPQAIGYKIYRRIGSYGFTPSNCEVGVPAYTGYNLIGQINGYSNTTFTDDNSGVGLAPAVRYCYMVVAVFPDGAESYASIEFCGKLIRDLPVITNVDVNSTDATTGTMYVAWGKPTELDTVQTPGPYRYVLQRAAQSGNYVDVVTYNSLNDTTFNDAGLNTSAIQYRYRVNFWNDTPGNTFLIGTSQVASSVFLSVSPGDEKNNLSWNYNVPWTNANYEIFRENISGVFVLVGTSTTNSFVDDSLPNGVNYCYYVTTYGAYLDTGLVNPIINKSQEACGTPLDNEPPCVPQFLNTANCELLTDSVSWIVDDSCASDLETVQIYFQAAGNDVYLQVASISGSANSYVYSATNSIAGCFYITATDSTGNVSFSSDTICVDPCPLYELPNIFTPDNNGVNDLFHPILPYRDVKDVEMKIFNRWGALMFETTDPIINWNGKRNNDGADAPEGVYFYICKVNQASTNTEIKQILLKGTIQLLRGDKLK
jgi:gliding motility-associated-like protein